MAMNSWSSRYQAMWPCYKSLFCRIATPLLLCPGRSASFHCFPLLRRCRGHNPPTREALPQLTSETKDKGLVHSHDIWWMWKKALKLFVCSQSCVFSFPRRGPCYSVRCYLLCDWLYYIFVSVVVDARMWRKKVSHPSICDTSSVTCGHLWHRSLNMWRFYTVIYWRGYFTVDFQKVTVICFSFKLN